MDALVTWMKSANLTPVEVARRSGHDVYHILKMFEPGGPTPTLRIYLDLLEAAGACFAGVKVNHVPAVLARINALRRRADLEIAELAKRAGMKRPHLSRICNGKQGIGIECFDSLVTALGAEEDMRLVARDSEQQTVPDPPIGTESPAAADMESKSPADSPVPRARTKKPKKPVHDRGASGLATDPEPSQKRAHLAAELAAMTNARDELLRDLTAERERTRMASEELARMIKERDDCKIQLTAERERTRIASEEHARVIKEHEDCKIQLTAERERTRMASEELGRVIKERDDCNTQLTAEREQTRMASEELARVIKERDDCKKQLIAEREQSAAAIKAAQSTSEAELKHERDKSEVVRQQLDLLREHIRNRGAAVINTLQGLTRIDDSV